jgi:hypothetical protein
MLETSLVALGAVFVIGVIAGVHGLMRKEAKKVDGLSRRKSTTNIRQYISERKWGIGLLLMFGISGIAIGVVSNLPADGPTTPITPPPGGDLNYPDLKVSGSNPNLTREGYPVTLSKGGPSIARLFDPAYRGTQAIWGLHVDQMRVVYYGADNQWHETSFQINEVGYRWVVNGSDDYMHTERHEVPGQNGRRPNSFLEEMQWQKGYVPNYFYPDLDN